MSSSTTMKYSGCPLLCVNKLCTFTYPGPKADILLSFQILLLVLKLLCNHILHIKQTLSYNFKIPAAIMTLVTEAVSICCKVCNSFLPTREWIPLTLLSNTPSASYNIYTPFIKWLEKYSWSY